MTGELVMQAGYLGGSAYGSTDPIALFIWVVLVTLAVIWLTRKK